ncbi:LysR family transcriptional regulator [Corynebacterium halotolerans]|uniref:LysR family transcriptional regulator n=1 Tax=Corynebacterium halotolerans TaxID=225326 RepID=UPI0009DA361E|nr:LysR family transcriptional regulator [Corynebacterium halotolerans]
MNLPINTYLAQLTGILPALRELGNGETITRTASNLGVSQPALSRAIARCESELSVKLIERAGRGIALTVEGRLLADAAAEALAVFQPALEDVLGERNARPVRLGALRSIAGQLGPLMTRSQLTSNVIISEGSADELLEKLDKGVVDAAIIGPRPNDPRCEWTFLRNQEFVLVVPRDHELAEREAVMLDEVAGESFVAMDAKYTTRDLADELCTEAGISPSITVESDSPHTLRMYVASGLGLCILPDIMASADPTIATVRILRPNGTPATREIGLVKMKARPLPTQVRSALRSLLARPLPVDRRLLTDQGC